MENNYFDKIMRERMENLGGDPQGGHWEQMEHLLNDPANADLSENELDHSLRNKLTDVEATFSTAHWNLFEQQLDTEINAPEIEDVYLDGVTYELLNDLESPYDPDHWTIMQKRLEEEFSIRYKLVKYKVAELALLVLALFTAVSYFPADKISTFQLPFVETVFPAKSTPATPEKVIETKKLNANTTPAPIAMTDLSNNDLNATAETEAVTSEPTGSTSPANTTKSINTIPPQGNEQLQSLSNPAQASTITIITKPETLPTESLSVPELKQKALTLLEDSNTDTPESKTNIKDLLQEQLRLIPLISSLEISTLPEESNNINTFIETNIWKSPSFLRIGMVGAGELNYILTPYNKKYDQAGYTSSEFGYGGGLTLGYKFRRWEIETGAMYSSKTYSPETVNITFTKGNIGYGYEGLGWTGTQLDVLRIPVRARFDLVNMGKWYLYTQAGLTGNFALNTIHSRKVFIYEPKDRSLRSPTTPSVLDFAAADTPNINENVGLLKDGSVKNNHYFTAEIGFGIERFLSPRFSFFSQPTFHYQINKSNTGLNRERINTISVEAGVRVSLKRNK